MRTVALRRIINLGPGDTVEVTLQLTVVNDTDGVQQVEGIRWEPVLVGEGS